MTHEKEKRRRESEAIQSVPLDLTSEILLRLPARAVARSRFVSKLWSSISTDPYFINSFETRSSTQASLVVCIKKGDNLFVSSFPQHNRNKANKSYVCCEPTYRYHMRIPKFSFTTPGDSVEGLICFEESGKPIIFNPSTGKLVTLRKPDWDKTVFILGYDPIQGKHKVLCLPRVEDEIIEEGRVITLGSAQESWRAIKTKHKHTPYNDISGRCINGVWYYMAYAEYSYKKVIMMFDFRSEKFDMMEKPTAGTLINYQGRLACADDMGKQVTTLWIWEDAKWLSKDISATCFIRYGDPNQTWDWQSPFDLHLKGITDAGEFIYAPSVFHKSFYILYGDPKSNSFRKVEVKGIADDEFKVGNEVEYEFRIFPNHIDRLRSW